MMQVWGCDDIRLLVVFYAFLVEFKWIWMIPKLKKTENEETRKAKIVSRFCTSAQFYYHFCEFQLFKYRVTIS